MTTARKQSDLLKVVHRPNSNESAVRDVN